MRMPKASNFEIGQRIHVIVRKNAIELHGEVIGITDGELSIMVDDADYKTSIPFVTMETLIGNTVSIKGSGHNVRLVGVKEAATLLGWDKRKISTYMIRGSFPEPIQRLASGSIWTYDQIVEFRDSLN